MIMYFERNGEKCMPLSVHLKEMKSENEKSRELFEAKIERNTGFIYCQNFDEISEKGECGKICSAYLPRNGKSGICKHQGHVYEQTDKKVNVKLEW